MDRSTLVGVELSRRGYLVGPYIVMTKTPPVYFSALEIENVRCFGGRQELSLTYNGQPARWSLLIGENGAGKTTLLECLAWMRPVPEGSDLSGAPAGLDDHGGPIPISKGLLNSALTIEENEILETLPRDGSRAVKLGAKLSFGGAGFWSDDVRSRARNIRIGMQLSFDDDALLRDFKPKRAQIRRLGIPFQDPLVVSYGANRYLGERNSLGVDEPD